MCGIGKNHKLMKKTIKEINDLNKMNKISGKRKRIIVIMKMVLIS